MFTGSMVAIVTPFDAQGRVVVYSGCAPHGQGLETTMSQVVADAFGMLPDEIVFRAGDTALVPYGVGTFASRSVVTAGAAIFVAGRAGCGTADYAATIRALREHALGGTA